MIVSKLRYKGYLWQYNPKELSVITEKKLHEQLVPDNKPIIQNFGNKSRIIRGTGCLCGEDCFKQYNRILELQKNGATIIFSTHNMSSVEELCNDIVLINKCNRNINLCIIYLIYIIIINLIMNN